MIRWKLREVMEQGEVTNRELARQTGHHETSISRLKTSDEMPRIDGETLDKLCKALTVILDGKGVGRVVTPSDLIKFSLSE